jgi:hypothetical protein
VLHLHKALAAASCRLMEQIERLTHEGSLEGLGQVKNAQVEVAEGCSRSGCRRRRSRPCSPRSTTISIATP